MSEKHLRDLSENVWVRVIAFETRFSTPPQEPTPLWGSGEVDYEIRGRGGGGSGVCLHSSKADRQASSREGGRQAGREGGREAGWWVVFAKVWEARRHLDQQFYSSVLFYRRGRANTTS